ncbi:unnamed protein product [Diamesa hyperborea]
MSYSWVSSSIYSQPPHNAVLAGHDSDRSPIYVGRAMEGCAAIPAKVIPCKQACYVSFNGKEILKQNFEYLVGSGLHWIGSGNGHAPAGAVLAGNDKSGEPHYIGRAHHSGSLTPGKIHQSHGCLYIGYGGHEVAIKQYEVLVAQKRLQWVHCEAYMPVPHGAILAGNDADGSPIFVGRAHHASDHLVAKVIPSKQIAYVSYDGQEIPKHTFEVLCHGNVQWVHSSNGQVVYNAVPGGRTGSGEVLYIGRGHYGGAVTVGKIQQSHGCLYIPYGGSEVSLRSYEILTQN